MTHRRWAYARLGRVRPIKIEGQIAIVPLTRGYEAIIDAADVHLVEGWNWHAAPDRNTVYARRNQAINGRHVGFAMHRVILQAPDDIVCDHIDQDGLNNRRSNLRLCPGQENNFNRKRNVLNKSGYKGVHWSKKDCKWKACIRISGKYIHLGMFDDPKVAHQAYKAASSKYHGEFGRVE